LMTLAIPFLCLDVGPFKS